MDAISLILKDKFGISDQYGDEFRILFCYAD